MVQNKNAQNTNPPPLEISTIQYPHEFSAIQQPDGELFGPPRIPNPEIVRRRRINFVICLIVYISAPIVAITYAVLWSLISPPLDLFEVGNWWTFLLLFASCGFILLVGIYPLVLHCRGFPVRYKQAMVFHMFLAECWFMVFFVAMGASEVFKDRSKCNHPFVHCTIKYAPLSPTKFGEYIARVCANSTLENTGANNYVDVTHRKDEVKCAAARRFQYTIYSMYIWVMEVLVCQLVDLYFGLGNWSKKDIPEMILSKYDIQLDYKNSVF